MHKYIYIDAHSGEVIDQISSVCSIADTVQTTYSGNRSIEMQSYGGQYRLRDYSRGNGIETLRYGDETDYYSTNTNWSNITSYDRAALDAHWGMEMTYDYYYCNFGRNSYDNAGSAIRTLVNMPEANAYWTGSSVLIGLVFGNTYACLDIIAHELTHAFTEYSSQLIYQGESGAINEGLSDAFAACVEKHVKPSNSYRIWQIAEDANLLRDMSNPVCKYYQGTGWIDTSSQYDCGGVHTNSGVFNYWFYLLTHGGGGTNQSGIYFSVDTVGFEKMEQICYYMNEYLLPSDATYSDVRTYSYLAANYLGYNTNVLNQIHKAWGIVGLEDIELSIWGASVPCDSSVYYVKNLPNNYTVTWSWETPYLSFLPTNLNDDNNTQRSIIDPSDPPLLLCPVLQQNTPYVNHCRLLKNGETYINNRIIAKVKNNGSVVATLYKTVNTGQNFIGYYSLPACYYSGYFYPGVIGATFYDGDTINVYKNSTITLVSNDFDGAIITYTGESPQHWSHSGNTITFNIKYLYPNNPFPDDGRNMSSSTTTTLFTCVGADGCECWKFTVIGENPPDAPNGELELTSSQDNEGLILSTGVNNWSISIVESTTGTLMYHGQVLGNSIKVDTARWKPGIYIVNAKSEEKTAILKVSVRRNINFL